MNFSFENFRRASLASDPVELALEAGDPSRAFHHNVIEFVSAMPMPEQIRVRQRFRGKWGKDFNVTDFQQLLKEEREARRHGYGAAGAVDSSLLKPLLNDHGNSERLIILYGEDLRYCHPRKRWYVWDGMRYALDEVGHAQRLAKQAILETLRQAIAAGNSDVEKFARQSLDNKRIVNLLAMAQSEIYVRPEELDTDPFALNFLNGTVDLRTGELRVHRRSDLITKLVHHRFEPDAECPLWMQFLDRIMGGGPDAGEAGLERASRLIGYLQRALGYSITGVTVEKAVFVPFGSGNNGKSVLLSTVREVVSEYSSLLQVDTLMVKQETSNTQADLADLSGARFVQTSESEEGARIAQGKLKRLSQGMGAIKAARKYENHIVFTETFKIWLDTNRKPVIKDADDKATFNRLHPIPFTETISDAEIDRELPRKLLTESHGILGWLVRGAIQWHHSGLGKPPEVEAAKQAWRAESDLVTQFIEARCVVGDAFRVLGSQLFAEYKGWSEESGERSLTANVFGSKISERFQKKHTERGATYLGVAIRSRES